MSGKSINQSINAVNNHVGEGEGIEGKSNTKYEIHNYASQINSQINDCLLLWLIQILGSEWTNDGTTSVQSHINSSQIPKSGFPSVVLLVFLWAFYFSKYFLVVKIQEKFHLGDCTNQDFCFIFSLAILPTQCGKQCISQHGTSFRILFFYTLGSLGIVFSNLCECHL